MNNGLADKHPVEGITVVRRKPVKIEGSFLVKRKGRNPMPFPLCGNESFGRIGQGQFSKAMFDGDFPGGNSAKVRLVGRVCEEFPSVVRKIGGFQYDPEES